MEKRYNKIITFGNIAKVIVYDIVNSRSINIEITPLKHFCGGLTNIDLDNSYINL